ncbi:MAG: sugar hydrolase [Planctomycetota bacterium]
MFEHDRDRWMTIADALAPTVHRNTFRARRVVTPVADPSVYQGWRLEHAGNPCPIRITQTPVIVDFGTHLVGEARFRFSPDSGRVLARFGEAPAEVCDDPAQHPGSLGGQWHSPVLLQPDIDGWATVPDRRALRYARLWVEQKGKPAEHATLEAAEVIAQTTAAWDDLPLPDTAEPWQRDLDRVALHTLRNCMHDVFEDGPKRDRRLWLGDLYLQAKASYLTFGRHDLVKRCLYLFAATSCKRGLVSPCVFARPRWHGSHKLIPSYAWLFAPCLLDYTQATGDTDTAADLFDIAHHQHTLFDAYEDPGGLFEPPDDELWRFIDWNDQLVPQAAEQAIAIYSLNALIVLAPIAGRSALVPQLATRCDALADAARQQLFNPRRGVFDSSRAGQTAWATQAWMVLAGVVTPTEARNLLLRTLETEDALPPITPYMQHYVIEAMFRAGLDRQAWQRLRRFWGDMIRHGADTFWEVYDPADPKRSPYQSHLHNSYCHAWSCTPSYFIRSRLRNPEHALQTQADSSH